MPDVPLPDWVAARFPSSRKQGVHGLNLALPLKHPLTDLPGILADIVAAGPQIQRALVELNFLHFARFVPSRSGRHLMVTTEFDGPIDAYVLDFAICIGDVFNRLLSRCEPHPRLPIGAHPDEFLAFVREWNRVPVAAGVLLPADFDYPLFAAYPDKTVLDIVGPRSALPSPVVDRPAAVVALADVQGNLLKGYRAQFATHFVVAIADADKARAWLAGLPVTDATDWGAAKPGTLLNVGFTFAGMGLLWPGRGDALGRFPQAFRDGPALRAEANSDTAASAPEAWLFGGPAAPAHAMLSIHAFQEAEWLAAASALAAELAPNGLRLLHTQQTRSRADGAGPFGYRDGIAQPRIAGQCSEREDMQPAASPGEFLLGAHYVDIYGGASLGELPQDIAANGSYCAVRLIEQDSAAFEQVLQDAVAAADNPATTAELVAAKLMGRWRDGTPVALRPTDAEWRASQGADADSNAFDYARSYEYPNTPEDHFGARCPVGAHVRRTNPRNARIAGMRHARRLIRRGLPTAWVEQGRPREGLFGLFFCGSLERQFEFILRHWINGDTAASGIRGTQDPIAGAGALGGTVRLPGLGRGGQELTLQVGRLTQTRGSLYLFQPGLASLRSLASAGHLADAAAGPLPVIEAAGRALAGIGNALDAAAARAAAATTALTAGAFDAMAHLGGSEISAQLWGALDHALGVPDGLAGRLRDALYAPAARPVPSAAVASPMTDPFDPTDPVFIADPYSRFARLRAAAPVQYVAAHRACWVTSRALVERLCREPALFRQKPLDTMLVGLLTMDDPRHALVRSAMDTAFSNASTRQAGIADEVVRLAMADLVRQPHVDLVAGFARRIARENFMGFFGVPPAERAEIDRLVRSVMLHADTTLDAVQQAIGAKDAAKLVLRLGKLLLRAGASSPPGDDGPQTPTIDGFRGSLLQQMALRTRWLPGMQGPMTILESVMTALQLALAGYLSTEFLLATACRNLLRPQPGQALRPWDRLLDGTANLDTAIDEARRFDSPLGVIERYAARDLAPGELAPYGIPKGTLLLGLLGSANRDPCDWPAGTDLTSFDPSRTQSRPLLTFGDGIHRCIGAPLQQRVVALAMRTLIDTLPTLRLQAPGAEPPWIPNLYFRSFTALPATTCP